MKHIKGLDTIRALAILLVILQHWGPQFHVARLRSDLITLDGGLGVDIFFVLSGFLITRILLNAKEQVGEVKHTQIFKAFYSRRFLRIFPIYYITLGVLMLLHFDPLLNSHAGYYFLYLSNILRYNYTGPLPMAHTWSLAVEEQFYLVWPMVILFTNKKYLLPVIWAFIAIGIISTCIQIGLMHGFAQILTQNCFDAFGLGGLYAYVFNDEVKLKRFQKVLRFAFPIALLINFSMLYKLRDAYDWQHQYFFSRTISAVIGLGLINFAATCKTKWLKNYVLENRFLVLIGTISYGIYLYHIPLGIYMDNWQKSGSHAAPLIFIERYHLFYFTKILTLLALSYTSYRLIERPFMRLKRKIKYVEQNKIDISQPAVALREQVKA